MNSPRTRGCPSSRLQLSGPRAGIRTSDMNKTSGFFDFKNANTSDLLCFNLLRREFAFQQQMDRTLEHSATAAGTLDGSSGPSSRGRLRISPAAGLKNRFIRQSTRAYCHQSLPLLQLLAFCAPRPAFQALSSDLPRLFSIAWPVAQVLHGFVLFSGSVCLGPLGSLKTHKQYEKRFKNQTRLKMKAQVAPCC